MRITDIAFITLIATPILALPHSSADSIHSISPRGNGQGKEPSLTAADRAKKWEAEQAREFEAEQARKMKAEQARAEKERQRTMQAEQERLRKEERARKLEVEQAKKRAAENEKKRKSEQDRQRKAELAQQRKVEKKETPQEREARIQRQEGQRNQNVNAWTYGTVKNAGSNGGGQGSSRGY